VADAAALRLKAYESALSDARSRAARLAELASGRLGKVLSLEEEQVGDEQIKAVYAVVQDFAAEGTPAAAGSSERNGKIELRQNLRVVFELLE
jgi:uncharacterized protein YggE